MASKTMDRAPETRSAPVVLGREDAVQLPDALLRLLLTVFVIAIGAAAFALVFVPATVAAGNAVKQFTEQFTATSPEDLTFPRFPERSTIFAADGKTRLATLYLDENRKIVRLDDIAPIALEAVLAIEDDRFYEHGPIDVVAIIRAALANLEAGEVQQGGSTITQQLVKGILTEGREELEQTLKRKIEEARLAYQIEEQYSKDEILELYVNEIYFGRGSYGIQAASEFYFGKSARRLGLAESATLAGLIAAPEAFNPVTEPEAALRRRNTVLNRMESLGWITAQQATRARDSEMVLSNKLRGQNRPGQAPYFVEYVRQEILRDPAFGKNRRQRERTLYQGGLRIITTLDPSWLQYAKESVTGNLSDPNYPQAAVVTVAANNGAIRTLLGGQDFKKQKFDIASQGRRQPGSAFKPFTLIAALEQGIPAGKVYDSSPKTFTECGAPWTPHNASGEGGAGYMNLYSATAGSVNLVFARLIIDAGAQNVVSAAHRMGIKTELPAVCSLTLGSGAVSPLEMASAYATLSNDGVHCEPYAVQRVIGPNGDLIKRHQPKCTQAIESKWARQVSDMLRGVVTGGTGTAAALSTHPVVGKTGTTNEYRDGWFVGYTWDQIATAVWVGDIKGEISIPDLPGPYGPLFGGNLPANIWHDYMERAVVTLPVNFFPGPPPIPRASVPNVIGKPLAEAEAILAESNFTATAVTVAANAPAGTVVGQSPGPGASVTAGSLVTLSVSNGQAPGANVPNVVGRTLQDARQRLQGAGFKVKVVYETVNQANLDGIVLGQSPSGGRHDTGSTVTLTVGKYKADPSPSPSPSPSPCDPQVDPDCEPDP